MNWFRSVLVPLVAPIVVSAPTLAQVVKATPNEDDIPKPVPVELGLAGDSLPDISRFLNVRTATSPSLSPDGKRLAFTTQISGAPQVWVLDRPGGWPRQITFGEPVTFHAWSPAGDWIVYGVDRGGNEREGFYLINPEGTVERELLAPSQGFRVFGGFTRDGKKIAYASTERNGIDFDIYLLDLETGRSTEVFRGRMGLHAVSWRADGGAVILSESRGEDANDVYLLDLASGRLDTLFRPPERAWYGGFSWTPEGRSFYLSTNERTEYAALARYDLGSRQLHLIEPDRDVEEVALSPDGRYLLWTTNEGGYSALHGRDLATCRPIAPPVLPPGVYTLGWAAAAPVAAISVAGPRIPGDIWVWNVAEGSLERATYFRHCRSGSFPDGSPRALQFPRPRLRKNVLSAERSPAAGE